MPERTRAVGALLLVSSPAGHLPPGDSLARGAVGDLVRQLISLLLCMAARSLGRGQFLWEVACH